MIVLLGIFAVYVASPIRQTADSRWVMHTAVSLLQGHAGDLTEFRPALLRNEFYGIEHPHGKPHNFFPIGVSVVTLPVFAAIVAIDPAFVDVLKQTIPSREEKIVACGIGAIASLLFFWIVRSKFQSDRLAGVGALIFAFGTSMWSTASRALWQHGPLAVMFLIAMLLLLQARKRPHLVPYCGLALGLAFIIRPSSAIFIAFASAYVLICHPRQFLKYIAWAMVVAIPWFAFNLSLYGSLFPTYFSPSRLGGQSPSGFWQGLAGVLFSPARGLFVYSPVMLFAMTGAVFAWRETENRPIHAAFGSTAIATVALYAAWPEGWWGGHSFGPRFLTDAVPFLSYFVMFNFISPTYPSSDMRRFGPLQIGVVLLALISAGIHAQGATRPPPNAWNGIPTNIDYDLDRLWDWRDMPFLRTREKEDALRKG